MFLCEKCVDRNCICWGHSYGRCEDCGKTAACTDCHCYGKNAGETKQTMTYTATFVGRTLGALGIRSKIHTVVEGATPEAARLALYDRYEHIQFLTLIPGDPPTPHPAPSAP